MFYIIVGTWILICIVRYMLNPKNNDELKKTFEK